MKSVGINEAIKSDGLRIIIVKAMPSAWGVAAKAMIEFKGLECIMSHQKPMSDNPELEKWSGVNSGPVVAWKDEPPINRWNDILFLLERLEPKISLIPKSARERILCLGLSHEICGELGFGWNRRLDFMRPQHGAAISEFAKKYGYTEIDAKLANERVINLMNELTQILESQKLKKSPYLIGESVCAVDFYWAAFSNFVKIQDASICPINPQARPMFENTPPEIAAHISTELIEHRDYIMNNYFQLPLEL